MGLTVDKGAVDVEEDKVPERSRDLLERVRRRSSGRQPSMSQVRAMCSGRGAMSVKSPPVTGWVSPSERACRCSFPEIAPPRPAPHPSPRFS